MTSAVRSPLRSSSALVATVVPILTWPTRSAGMESSADYAEQVANALDGGVRIGLPGFSGQQLALVQRAIGRAANHIGECAAAVDPEIHKRPS